MPVIFVGAFMMAGFGSALAGALQLPGKDHVLLVGFAVGVILLGQAPAIRLSRRIRDLEKRLPPSSEVPRL
jgi:hypothetical protein